MLKFIRSAAFVSAIALLLNAYVNTTSAFVFIGAYFLANVAVVLFGHWAKRLDQFENIAAIFEIYKKEIARLNRRISTYHDMLFVELPSDPTFRRRHHLGSFYELLDMYKERYDIAELMSRELLMLEPKLRRNRDQASTIVGKISTRVTLQRCIDNIETMTGILKSSSPQIDAMEDLITSIEHGEGEGEWDC